MRLTKSLGPWVMLVILGLLGSAAQAEGVLRRLVYANSSWQGAYMNTTAQTQRVRIHADGAWSYQRGGVCSRAGVPWNEDLKEEAQFFLAPECAPYSLIGLLSLPGEEPSTMCLGGDDAIMLPPEGSVSFSINDTVTGFNNNSGAIRMELLIMER